MVKVKWNVYKNTILYISARICMYQLTKRADWRH